MPIPGSREALLAQSAVTAALGVARRRGFPVAKTVEQAEARRRVLDDLTQRPEVQPRPLNDVPPGKLETVLTEYATDHARVEEVRTLAQRVLPGADDALADAIRNEVVGWVTKLVPVFDEKLSEARDAADAAPAVGPDQLARLSPVAFTAWQTHTACALELDRIVADRITLGRSVGENPTHRWGRTLAAHARVAPPDVEPGEMQAAFAARAERFQAIDTTTDPATRWRAWVDLEQRGWLHLALAAPSQIPTNVRALDIWQQMFDERLNRDGGRNYQAIREGARAGWHTIRTHTDRTPATTR